MTITGTGFIGASAVHFGSNPATSLTVTSATDHGRLPGGVRHGQCHGHQSDRDQCHLCG